MRQEDLNEMMREPGETKAIEVKQLPKCPTCGDRYLGDGVTLCLDCAEKSRRIEGGGGRGMTDKGLLELAAKAAGIEQGAECAECGISTTLPDGRHGHLPRWNPLDDDGDALRLAAQLSLHIEWRLDGRVAVSSQDQVAEIYIMESSREDRCGSLRRAIVRAAAALAQHQGEKHVHL